MLHDDHVSTSLEVSSLIVPGTELGEDTSSVSESFRFCCFRGAESIGGVDQGRHMVTSSDSGCPPPLPLYYPPNCSTPQTTPIYQISSFGLYFYADATLIVDLSSQPIVQN